MDWMDLPRILKWVTQVGLVIVSAWSLWDGKTIREEQGGRDITLSGPYGFLRRLSAHGWTKLTLLAVTFAFFILSDVNDKKAADERTAEAQRQATTLRQLYLAQFRVSRLSVTWRPDGNALKLLVNSASSDRPANPNDLLYLRTALEHGDLLLRAASANRGLMFYSLARPQGEVSGGPYRPEDMAWHAVENSLYTLWAGLRIEFEGGSTVIDPMGAHWPCDVRFNKGEVTFSAANPGIDLGAFVTMPKIVVRTGRQAAASSDAPCVPRNLPSSITIRSEDPRLHWSQEIKIRWIGTVVDKEMRSDGEEIPICEFSSDPLAITAALTEPLRSLTEDSPQRR
jgi:hypothetical protein